MTRKLIDEDQQFNPPESKNDAEQTPAQKNASFASIVESINGYLQDIGSEVTCYFGTICVFGAEEISDDIVQSIQSMNVQPTISLYSGRQIVSFSFTEESKVLGLLEKIHDVIRKNIEWSRQLVEKQEYHSEDPFEVSFEVSSGDEADDEADIDSDIGSDTEDDQNVESKEVKSKSTNVLTSALSFTFMAPPWENKDTLPRENKDTLQLAPSYCLIC